MDYRRMRARIFIWASVCAAAAVPLSASEDADPPLVLEYRAGTIRQSIIVTEGMPFYVATQIDQDLRVISGTVGTLDNDRIEIEFRVEHRFEDYSSEGVHQATLTLNEMGGYSVGGSGSVIGGMDLSDVWIRRGLDPLPHLRTALASRDLRAFFAGCRYVQRVGEAAKEMVPLLVEAAVVDGREVQIAAIQTLGRLGPVASDAACALEDLLDDASAEVRAAAEEALNAIRSR